MRFTAMNRGQRGKLAMATAALGIGLLSVTGCGYINPQQTSEQYSASDGTRTDLGPLQLRNFIIVSDGEDKPGRVIGAVYNTSSKDVVLTIKRCRRIADPGSGQAELLHPAQRLHRRGDPEHHRRQAGRRGRGHHLAKTAPTRTPSSRSRSWTPRSPTTRSTCRRRSPPAPARPRRPRRAASTHGTETATPTPSSTAGH